MRSMRRAAGGLLTAAVFLAWLPQQGCGSGDEQVGTPAPPDQRACLALPARSYTGEVACLPLDDDDEHVVGELRTIWGEQPSSICAYQPGVVELMKCVPFLVPYGNAFYCGVDDSLGWDDDLLTAKENQVGAFASEAIISHEWGHLVQARTGIAQAVGFTKPLELHADCLAGVASAILEVRNGLSQADLEEGFRTFCSVGGIGTGWFDASSHGSCLERASAFALGVAGARSRLGEVCSSSVVPVAVSICESCLDGRCGSPAPQPEPPPPPPPPAEPICGDGIAEGVEVCDGGDLRGQTCESLGYSVGSLACASDCRAFETSPCSRLDGPSYRFRLTWRSDVDMDIQVITPNGSVIGPGASSSADGGTLDGNDRGGSGVNEENVGFGASELAGQYRYLARLRTEGLPNGSQVFCFEVQEDGSRRRIRAGNLPLDNGSLDSPIFAWPPTPPDSPECPPDDDTACRCPSE